MFVPVTWSTVKIHSDGVFDISFVCPHCSYAGWARAYGEAVGTDTGLYGTASIAHAMYNADLLAQQAAMRAVLGSPCPKCNKHHPQIEEWADNAARENAKREGHRGFAIMLSAIGIVLGILTIAITYAFDTPNLFAFGAMVSATVFFLGPSLWLASRPLKDAWKLHDRAPDGVQFLSEDPYRGKSVETKTDQRAKR